MHVQTAQLELRPREYLADALRGRARRDVEPELRLRRPGLQMRVRSCGDTRADPEEHPLADTADAREPRQELDLLEVVDDDAGDV